MSGIEIFLKKAEEYIEDATKAETQGEHRKARDYYLRASKQLYDAASDSQGKMKTIRVDNAEKLLAKAKSIKIKEKEAAGKGEESSSDFILHERPNVTFDDVAGLENVKEEIKNKIIYPFLYPDKAKKFGIKSGGGILLYGPPGTGKTYIAKAVASEVDAAFFSIKPSEIMSKWVGESEQNIAKLFDTARSQKKSVIFIDEVEALIPKRKDSGSTVMQRVVPQILAEMEGVESKNENLLFVGATNEPWSIDHAALRPGRFDEKIYVPPPDFEARKRMFELNLKGKPLASDIDFAKLTEMTEGYSGADIRQICLKASLVPFRENIQSGNERSIEMRDLAESMNAVKPSIDTKTIEKYEKFGQIKAAKEEAGDILARVKESFPSHYVALLLGPPGVGKHEFCLDLAKHYLRNGESVVYVTTEKRPREIKDRMSALELDLDGYEGKKFIFIDMYSHSTGEVYERGLCVSNPANLNSISVNLKQAIEAVGSPARIILDSLSTLFLHASSSEITKFFASLSSRIKTDYGFAIYTLQEGMHDEYTMTSLKHMADAVLEMKFEEAPLRRKLRVQYAKGIATTPEWIDFSITDRGFTIVGRKKD